MRVLSSLALVTLLGAPLAAGAAQIVDDGADRSPRFLVAVAPSKRPKLLDIARAPVLRRRVSLDLKGVTLAEALASVAEQADLQLMYSKDIIPLERRVTLEMKAATVAAALTDLLLDANVDVLFSGADQAVLVRRAKVLDGLPETGSIVGRVTDAKTGAKLAGAELIVEQTTARATTDSTGWYRLAGIDTGAHLLTIRRLGYTKQTRRLTVRAEQVDTVNVVLEPAARKLNDLVTTATGQQRRRDLGNAITTIRADSVLQNAPIRNLTDLLEGRVPGLTVQHTTGAPGDPARLRLRGLGSALRSNDPVVIVDGVRIYAAQSGARSGNLTNLAPPINDAGATRNPAPAPSPLDQIDPNIIDKIEVFKGPSAATLYGADAANGVIVITTKRGKPGPTQWRASLTHGRTSSPGRYPTANFRWGHDTVGIQYPNNSYCTLLDYRCVQDSLTQFQALNDPTLTVLGHGKSTALSLTASGGSQALTYAVTGSYDTEDGLLRLPPYEAGRFQARFNRTPPDWMQRPLSYRTWRVTSGVMARLGQTADVTLQTSLARSDQARTSLEDKLGELAGAYVDTINGRYYLPTVTKGTLENFVYGLSSSEGTAYTSGYYRRRTASTITFTTGLNAQWHPRSWFNATGQAGVDVVPRDDRALLPAALVSPLDSGAVVHATGRSLVSTVNVQGTLRKPLGASFVFETSVGANLTATTTNDLATSAAGLVGGTTAITGASLIRASELESRTSVFGWYIEPRISGQRFSLSTGLRLDGGSAYGVRLTRSGGGGLFGLLGLPKLNGSWVISEEPWFPFNAVFSSLRLRGAYGQAQVQPGPADRLRLYTGTADQPNSELALTGLGNSRLRPERSTEFEGGFDVDLLDSRVMLEATAYRKLQVDALMSMTVPPSVNGGGTVLTNIGNIRNTGVELTLGITPVRTATLTWNAQLNYSRNNNIVTRLGDGVAASRPNGLVEGYPLNSRWARPILDYADRNGDGVLQPGEIQVGDSLVYMGRLLPAYQTTLFSNLSLFGGAIGVTAGFSYDAGQTQIDETLRTNFVLVRALVDPSVPLAEQAATWATTRVTDPTDYGLMQQVSTFRFSSLSVNYRAPARFARLIGAQQLSLALQGSNLALHSNYRGKDPDVSAWSAGESIVDSGQLPQPRLWQLRFDLQY